MLGDLLKLTTRHLKKGDKVRPTAPIAGLWGCMGSPRTLITADTLDDKSLFKPQTSNLSAAVDVGHAGGGASLDAD